jgi:hypothetical protein
MGPTEVRRVVDAVGRATGHMLMAEDQLDRAVDILRVVEASNEELPETARACFRQIVDKSRTNRIRIIEFGELLTARYDREN